MFTVRECVEDQPEAYSQENTPFNLRSAAHLPARVPVVRFLLTAIAVVFAGLLGIIAWSAYMAAPWTRDGTVRAYVITETPEVSGRIVDLPVAADQFVRKGQLLLEIDPTDYRLAVSNAEAAFAQAKANAENRREEAGRRLKLTTLSTSSEEQQRFVTQSQMADAVYQQEAARLEQARVNLQRTRIVSPINGYITNLTLQPGDYAAAGQHALTIVDTESFWVDGYFEETQLAAIHPGDPARVSLMGFKGSLRGHVAGISRGITVANAQSDPAGLATVNPVYTWIRLAQRVPVRIAIDYVPPEVTLVAGLTAAVQIEPRRGER